MRKRERGERLSCGEVDRDGIHAVVDDGDDGSGERGGVSCTGGVEE